MRFLVAADTDKGNIKETNQDSLIVKHAVSDKNEALMAIICDGMGGLSKGELASATVIRTFDEWFDNEFTQSLEEKESVDVSERWCALIEELNNRIIEYSKENGISLGTTFTGILMIDEDYTIIHVGDTRAYYMNDCDIKQLTEDQTLVRREINKGLMTEEEAEKDHRRNVLLQCIGASKVVEPQALSGKLEKGSYLLCSDGFRHEISEHEMQEVFMKDTDASKEEMTGQIRMLIDLVKTRGERDNISAILIKVK